MLISRPRAPNFAAILPWYSWMRPASESQTFQREPKLWHPLFVPVNTSAEPVAKSSSTRQRPDNKQKNLGPRTTAPRPPRDPHGTSLRRNDANSYTPFATAITWQQGILNLVQNLHVQLYVWSGSDP